MKKRSYIYLASCMIAIGVVFSPCECVSSNYEYADDVIKAEHKKRQEERDVVWKELRSRIGDVYEASPGVKDKKITFFDKSSPNSRMFNIKKEELFTVLDGQVISGCKSWLSISEGRPKKCNYDNKDLYVIYEVELSSGKLAYLPVRYPSFWETGRELVSDNIKFIRNGTIDEVTRIITESRKRRGKNR